MPFRNRLCILLLLALAGCSAANSRHETPASTPMAAPSTAVTTFECLDGFRFRARTLAEEAQLFLDQGQTLTVPRLISASGAKYGNNDVIFWSKGDEALLRLGVSAHGGCRAVTPTGGAGDR